VTYPEGGTLVMHYDDVPPSLNQVGTRGNFRVVAGHKKRWQKIVTDLLIASGMPRGVATRVKATASIRMPTRRRRDEGNWRWLIEKCLGDALQLTGKRGEPPTPAHLRWLPDDTPEHYRFGRVIFEEELGPKRITIRIRWWA
jgi:hypothetical protein